MDPIVQITVLIAVAAYTLFGSVWDIRTRRLPNWLTVPMFILGLVLHMGVSGLSGLGFSLAGFATGFGILFVLMAIGGGAGGDVKFMGALGAWVGWKAILLIFIGSGLIAAIGMVLMIIWGFFSPPSERSLQSDGKKKLDEEKKVGRQLIPYAVYASVSAWIVVGGTFTLKWMATS